MEKTKVPSIKGGKSKKTQKTESYEGIVVVCNISILFFYSNKRGKRGALTSYPCGHSAGIQFVYMCDCV